MGLSTPLRRSAVLLSLLVPAYGQGKGTGEGEAAPEGELSAEITLEEGKGYQVRFCEAPPRPSMPFHGLPWPSMAFHGLPWPSMPFHDLL